MLKQVVFTLLTLAYPLVVWLGGGRFEPRWLALVLVTLGVARLVSTRQRTWVLVGVLALALASLAAAFNVGWPLKLYPLVVNGSLLALFGATLARPPSMVERLARLTEKAPLPPHAVAYTRRVTQVWCAFFALNGAASAFTAVACSERTWALYNGGLAYGLMGALFVGELVVRRWVKRTHAEESTT